MKTRIIRMNPRELKLLEQNARFMRHETFKNLVDNVKRDGVLSGVPFACLEPDGKYLVLSGNHRTMAACEAGLPEIDVMVTEETLSEEQKLAIQLSHNALVGEDDPAMLKELYQRIGSVDFKSYAGLDDKTLKLLEEVKIGSLAEANLDFQTVSFTFLPEEAKKAEEALEEAKKLAKADRVLLARWGEYDAFLDALEAAGAAHGIKNQATALMVILHIFRKNLEDLKEGWKDTPDDKRWVPLSTLFGTEKVPVTAARVIAQAIERVKFEAEITEKGATWRALELLAADYLGGVPATGGQA